MVLENVKHIKRIDNGKVFQYIMFELAKCGYSVKTFDLSPHHLGIPQNRERVIFICIRNDIPNPVNEFVIKKREAADGFQLRRGALHGAQALHGFLRGAQQ